MTGDDRRYDVGLWGATGFTGQLVAEHFAEHYTDGLEWGITRNAHPASASDVKEDKRVCLVSVG